ncbi:type II toxin-antitoxin system RelE/ParE family toxin [Oricola thermophila]|uniref:Type II toxin-antitoxin system RelE/ParE family toxin n=1 Tax=Oricola thermophila TaxID=2742145 RepID=A0A6N1VI86_9HYPH|nr:type II toxin-antitoxin system RelE/ParE family toxin [Oricola thermophila]QKV19435.1 type II toxin-antitoxin system RelE/ParE family toxin [Oricola thermophila]
MGRYRLTPRAEEDLRAIWRAIAPENEAAADALLMRIFDRLELAAEQPRMGAARPELSATARILVEGNYIVIYEPEPDGILVIAVVHGMRDPANWL